MTSTHDDPAMAIEASDLLAARDLLQQIYADELRFPGSPITPELVAISLDHVDRVRRNAAEIAAGEGLDGSVLELAAILHDVSKLDHRDVASGGIDTWHHHARGASLAKKLMLSNLRKPVALADRIASVIETHSHIPFIRRFWAASYHADLPAPSSREEIALRDADVIDMLWVGGIAKIVRFRQVAGSEFFKEDGGDIRNAIASARTSFEESAGILSLPTARRLAAGRVATVQSFLASLAPVRSLADFVRLYTRFEEEHTPPKRA